MMGAGKSTVGPLVAARAGCPFLDLDQLIVERWQEGIAKTFQAHGEAVFREREAQVLHEVALMGGRRVLAAGGGAPLRSDNRTRLHENFWVVWLDGPAEILYARAEGPERPLAGDGWAAFRGRAEARRPLYADLADLRVDVAEVSPDSAAALIRDWWLEQEG